MTNRALLWFALLSSVPASAAERVLGVGSFTRLRISGSYDVRVIPGSPRVRVSGDREAIEAIEASNRRVDAILAGESIRP